MRTVILISLLICDFSFPAVAQHAQPRRDNRGISSDINSDEKAEETRKFNAKAKERQRSLNNQNKNLWDRWIYAVCLGRTWAPKNVRIVHTHPSRVLMGIPAAEDDARERADMRIGT
ncbi:hypothetical protein [Methylobacterium sp. J-077]|uniref:hypothetical protein n=1 Tax=Methylobacterium sp. J-077 TaxID=2836656 RepID=UPI001FB86737|nr:hypothetical protein [Methylobacterium sp. J-077]MCJ2123139.1 hypothetical protein [Methylobacterium sp. J-077]